MNQLAKGLPANPDAERSILGAILLDNSAYNQAAAMLTPDKFSLDSHRRIFHSICEMMEKSKPVDLVTLCEELKQQNALEAVGGMTYISSLTDGLPRISNVEHYAKIIHGKALLRHLILVAGNISEQAMEGSEEPEEILDFAESSILAVNDQQNKSKFLSFAEIFRERYKSLDEILEQRREITGLETGIRRFDEMTRGMQPGNLIIIAARPGLGKTSIALDIARYVSIRRNRTAGIFSLEMSREELNGRLLAGESQVPFRKIQAGRANREELRRVTEAYLSLSEAPLYIDDTPGISLTEMRGKSRRLKAEHGLSLMVVDYLQLMGNAPGRRQENRTQEISAISRGLKGLAKEMHIPVIAVSQLSRMPEERFRPRLPDLRESGQIEQDADVVAFLYRDAPDPEDRLRIALTKMEIAKQRNGPTGIFDMAFCGPTSSFVNVISRVRETTLNHRSDFAHAGSLPYKD